MTDKNKSVKKAQGEEPIDEEEDLKKELPAEGLAAELAATRAKLDEALAAIAQLAAGPEAAAQVGAAVAEIAEGAAPAGPLPETEEDYQEMKKQLEKANKDLDTVQKAIKELQASRGTPLRKSRLTQPQGSGTPQARDFEYATADIEKAANDGKLDAFLKERGLILKKFH